ncbi:MAG: molybdopterin oxidoreductase family protein [Candidatus Bathyarchaeia archaeon]
MKLKTAYKGNVTGTEPWAEAAFNNGRLCSRGVLAYEQLRDPTRLRKPLIRKNGRLAEASWREAISYITGEIRRISARHSPNAVGFYGSGRRKTEAIYLFHKLAAVGVGTSSVSTSLSQCHPAAVEAYIRAFGSPRNPNPFEDVAEAGFLLIIGANPAECHPVLMNNILKAKSKGGTLVVVDPERTQTAKFADVHLQVKPGTDAVFLQGLLHECTRLGLVDESFMAERTRGFDELRKSLSSFTAEYASSVTEVPRHLIVDMAQRYAASAGSMILHGYGLEAQPDPVEANLAVTNLALATGQIGGPGRGCLPLPGQPNAQGTTQVTAALQILNLPRSRSEDHRGQLAKVWGVPLEKLPSVPTLSGSSIMDACLRGELKALYIYGSNPVASMTELGYVKEALEKLELLVVHDAFATEAANMAHAVLPGSCWVEEDGTVTSGEGRMARIGKITRAPDEAEEDWRIFTKLAESLGAGRYFTHASVETVFEEFKQLTSDLPLDCRGVTYERLNRENGVFIPCASGEDPGTKRLYEHSFATEDGRGVFAPCLSKSAK